MDRDERMNRPLVAYRRAFRGFISDVWTALPGIVQSYDAAKRTVTVQPAIQAQVQNNVTGEWSSVNLPVLPDVPVLFAGGGGFLITVPISAGDEGLVVFASRCIDAWWQQGGVQPQAENRMHDLSDGFFLPSPMSQPQEIPDVSSTSVQIRSKDGAKFMEFTAAGDLRCTGNIIAGFDTVDQVGLQTHVHPGNNQPPTPGS